MSSPSPAPAPAPAPAVAASAPAPTPAVAAASSGEVEIQPLVNEKDKKSVKFKDVISMGTFEFVPVSGFREAIEDPNFSLSRFLDVLTTILGCDMSCSEEADFSVDEQLPYLAMAAAECPYVLGEIDGETHIDVALRLVPDDLGRTQFTTLENPIPAEILVASVQPDVDHEQFWFAIEKAFEAKGQRLNEDEVLEIIKSDDSKLQSKSFFKRIFGYLQSPVF